MTRKELLDNLEPICDKYLNSNSHSHWKGTELREDKYALLVHELVDQWRTIKWFNPLNPSCEICSKIKFFGSYRRKEIVRIFSELCLRVTRYTREYGKTIVHFEPTSHSPQ